VQHQILTIDLILTGITIRRHRSTIRLPRLTIRPRPITRHYGTVGIRIMHDIMLVDSIFKEDRWNQTNIRLGLIEPGGGPFDDPSAGEDSKPTAGSERLTISTLH
jgi:hypothetical protein